MRSSRRSASSVVTVGCHVRSCEPATAIDTVVERIEAYFEEVADLSECIVDLLLVDCCMVCA